MTYEEPDDIIFDLSGPFANRLVPMQEIYGDENTVGTDCLLSRDGELLRVRVQAVDDNILDLVATVPVPGQIDRFLYEEDCIQVAVAYPGSAAAADLLLANPMGKVTAAGKAKDWPVHASRHAKGWSIEVAIPADQPVIGLSVHRFFRGVKNEVHGLTPTLPHPLDPEGFAAIVLGPKGKASYYFHLVAAAKEKSLQTAIDAARARLAKRTPLPAPWTELAAEKARLRAAAPLNPDTRYLCWNEGHFQHALLNLWQLTGDRTWLEIAVERMEGVWECTGDRRGEADHVWGIPQPTWYDEKDELGAAITLITGVILYPMARLLREVWSDDRLADLRPRLQPWFDRCRRAIAVHDCEWVELPDGSGVYLEPYVKGPARVYPHGGSRICPLNRMYFLAMPMLMLGRLEKDDSYLGRVKRMARFFRESLEEDENGALVWEYESQYYPATGEDISHAACQVRFTELCKAEGIEFTEKDLRAIARTLQENIFLHGNVPCGEVRGLTPGLDMSVGAWSSLCRFVPDVLPRIAAVIETAYTERPEFFEKEGWGIYLLTEVEKARRGISI
ncbi:MAG: hypothetical protein ACYDCO_05220 [Armatimonadota bacterium]